MRFTARCYAILVLLFIIASFPLSSHAAAASSPVALAIFSEDSNAPSLVDPTFVIGTSFNMTVQASNLPAATAQSGGLSGFDIILSYNSSILKVNNAGFNSPFCPQSDGCIFDLPANDTLTVARSFDSPSGQSRLAMLGLGPSHRSVPPSIMGQPSILFRVEFDVIGKGVTPVNIEQSTVQLLGLDNGCGSLLPFTVSDGSFDNRDPFTVSATPSSAVVSPGSSVPISVNVSQVNSAGRGNVSLVLSGIVPVNGVVHISYTFNPQWMILDASSGTPSFISTLTIHADSNTPLGNYALTIIGVIPPSASNPFQYNLNFTLSVGTSPMAVAYAALISGPKVSQSSIATPTLADPPSLLASFTVSASAVQGLPVTFNAVAVWCGSPPYGVRWNFGDGTSATTNPVTHTYNSTGSFPVMLTVVDSNGTTSISTQTLNVFSPPSSHPPSILPEVIAGGILLALFVSGLIYLGRRKRSS